MAHLTTSTTAEFLFTEHASKFDFAGERRRLRFRAAALSAEEQCAFARAVSASVIAHYWKKHTRSRGLNMSMRLPPVPAVEISAERLAEYGTACAQLDTFDAFFQIGELYTSLLPAEHRARHGIYYTPPAIVRRLLELMERAGANWKTARVLDPACGGAAFAAYVAERMLAANAHLPAEARLRDLRDRLVGIDIDPFATWISAVLLDVVCLPLMHEAKTHLDGLVRSGDSLRDPAIEQGEFDVVIGNPPYGKVKLSAADRARFKRSLYGHANLYGLFTERAVSLVRPGGVIGFVTPTSFLGGEYFKNLRHLMLGDAPPVRACFVSDREGIFSDVLQETVLTVFQRTTPRLQKNRVAMRKVEVESISARAQNAFDVADLGTSTLPQTCGAPWIMPRSRAQLSLVRQLGRMTARLPDYGYRVVTGQLVWNRHKPQFRTGPGPDCYPVLWAECIRPDGSFEFRSEKRDHRPYFQAAANQEFLVNCEPCVLLQRTTSKEQPRRLIAAAIPNSFIVEHPGYVVENHVNMLVPTTARPAVSLAMLARLLNSKTIDRAFRCISGSVAVSAYELENLPLPTLEQLLHSLPPSQAFRPITWFEERIRGLYDPNGE